MKKNIFLDYAAATPIDSRVQRAILRYMKIFGNPSSLHRIGREAKSVLNDSRRRVAGILNCRPEEIIFTGSGTESDNLGILGTAMAYEKMGKHIVTSKIEHHAVLRACRFLEKERGFKITYVDVGSNGIINPETVRRALRSDTILVSIVYANNEIGTIQSIKEIAKVIKESKNKPSGIHKIKPIFHTDACQAAGAEDLNVQNLGVDSLTLNGSKIYGPKGIGCLYVRRGVSLHPIIFGGDQEGGLRSGTENVPAIAGFAEALEIIGGEIGRGKRRISELRDYLIAHILNKIPDSHLNGDPILRLPNNVSISFKNIDGEMLVLLLDQEGISVSTGAACTTTDSGPSHVLKAIKSPSGWGNVRITLGRETTKKDVDYILKVLPTIVQKLRSFSK
ncbi:MAG: cysteine desulfurase [Candidatus Yanofskybacteria bacterium]|nr:cysteine desulfurase [Candidatus Yanofskybacteria bacterium]